MSEPYAAEPRAAAQSVRPAQPVARADLAGHPRLRHLAQSAPPPSGHDRGRGWRGAAAFNTGLFLALLVAFLAWRGLIGPAG